jgi:hypothetical protein
MSRSQILIKGCKEFTSAIICDLCECETLVRLGVPSVIAEPLEDCANRKGWMLSTPAPVGSTKPGPIDVCPSCIKDMDDETMGAFFEAQMKSSESQ